MVLGAELNKFGQYSHSDTMLARALRFLGGKYFLAAAEIRPSTPTIVNVSTTTAGWTAIATGLSNVVEWRLSERNNNNFRYAYVASPSTYATGFGVVEKKTDITAIYVQDLGADRVTMELEYWTI